MPVVGSLPTLLRPAIQIPKPYMRPRPYINPALARIVAEEGLGLDVVSGGELAVAVAGDVPLGHVYFTATTKRPPSWRRPLPPASGRIVVDSFHELDLLERICAGVGKTQDILVRVSPGIDPHTHVYTTTGVIDSKFGFSIQTGDAERAIVQALAAPHLNLRGLHFHLGSPIFELEPYQAATDLVLRFAAGLREQGLDLQEFSPGGGFAIAYTRNDQPPAPDDYAEAIVSTLTATCAELGMEQPSLVIEPGRSIIGPAGVALYSIGAIKHIPGIRTYVSVDGGMGDNIRPALYQATYEVLSANRPAAEPDATVTIARQVLRVGRCPGHGRPAPRAGCRRCDRHTRRRCVLPVDGQQLQPQPASTHHPRARRREPSDSAPGVLRRLMHCDV